LISSALPGRKGGCHSIPYKAITHFVVETAGSLDRDADMKIWVSGTPTPLEREFKKAKDPILEIQKMLTHYILN